MTTNIFPGLLSALAQAAQSSEQDDEIAIHEEGGKFSIVCDHSSLCRCAQHVISSVASFFENAASALCGRKILFGDRARKQQQRAKTIDLCAKIFGSQRLKRAAAWCGVDLDGQKGCCLRKREISLLFHSMAQITTDDINELLAEIHSDAPSVRGCEGKALEALRASLVNTKSVEACSFEEIRTLEALLLPFSSPNHLFWDDPARRFNSLFGPTIERVAWTCHLLRTHLFPLKDWEVLVGKRLSQPALPKNLLIPHPNGAYLHFCAQVEGGGASKRFFRTLHPAAADPMILYRGTRGPDGPLPDAVHSWLEDLRRELGASGPIATYDATKQLLEDPSRGFVSSPQQQVALLTNSIGGPQAMRDALLFSRRVRRITTNVSPGVDKETAALFRAVMAASRAEPMVIIHNIDKGDIVDTVGDEHIGGGCQNVSLTFRSLRPADSPPSQGAFANRLRDFLLPGPAIPPKIIGIFEAHARATTADRYHDETISTDDPATSQLATNYARHLPPHFDPSWEEVRHFFCPAPSPSFATFARQHLRL